MIIVLLYVNRLPADLHRAMLSVRVAAHRAGNFVATPAGADRVLDSDGAELAAASFGVFNCSPVTSNVCFARVLPNCDCIVVHWDEFEMHCC